MLALKKGIFFILFSSLPVPVLLLYVPDPDLSVLKDCWILGKKIPKDSVIHTQSSITVLRSLHLQLLFTCTVTCYTATTPHHSAAAAVPHHNLLLLLLLHTVADVPHAYSFSSLLIIFVAAAHHPRCSFHLHHFIYYCWIDIYLTHITYI